MEVVQFIGSSHGRSRNLKLSNVLLDLVGAAVSAGAPRTGPDMNVVQPLSSRADQAEVEIGTCKASGIVGTKREQRARLARVQVNQIVIQSEIGNRGQIVIRVAICRHLANNTEVQCRGISSQCLDGGIAPAVARLIDATTDVVPVEFAVEVSIVPSFIS